MLFVPSTINIYHFSYIGRRYTTYSTNERRWEKLTGTAGAFANFLAATFNCTHQLPTHQSTSPLPDLEMAAKRIENPIPETSQLSELIDSISGSTNPQTATTLQILHNLQHQHLWTSLQIHASPSDAASSPQEPRPTLISGIPPHRVYTHPDEQLYMLEKGLREDDLHPERLFVIPTAQGQNWSLSRMAAVFDALPEIKNATVDEAEEVVRPPVDSDKAQKLDEYYQRREKANATREWGAERVLLGMVNKEMGGDGTVVYYIVQEGEVKPRQN